MDNYFSIDELIAEASTVRWFDCIVAAVRIAMHEVRV
jgi:hypothetical protein